MYTMTDFKTKKQLKEAVANGDPVTCYQPGPFSSSMPTNGSITLEGPHYPAPHTWYAQAELKDGVVVKVK